MTLSDFALECAARNLAGPGASIRRQDRNWRGDYRPPIGIAIDTAEEKIMDMVVESMGVAKWHPFVVFWIENGVPENCSLPNLMPAVVTFNTRYLDLLAQARISIQQDSETAVMACEQVGLQIAAELALRYGSPEIACYLFVKSQLYPVLRIGQVSSLDLEFLPVDEAYMPIWFYALLHEVGHVAAWHPVSSAFTDDFFRTLVDNVLAVSLRETDLIRFRMLHSLGMIPSLEAETLRHEVSADLFSVDVLLESTKHLMRESGDIAQFSPFRLATCILDEFQLFQYLNKCATSARRLRGNVIPDPDPTRSFAHTVRLNVLIHYLANYVINNDWRYSGNEEGAAKMRMALRKHVQSSPTGILNTAFKKIEVEYGLIKRRKDDLFADLKKNLDNDINRLFFHVTGRSFLSLAESLEVSHPDLDVLRRYC